MAAVKLDLAGTFPALPSGLRHRWADTLRRAADDVRRGPEGKTPPVALKRMLGLSEDALITLGVRCVIPTLAAMGRRVIVESPTFGDVPRLFEAHGADVTMAPLAKIASLRSPPESQLLWVTSPCRNPDGGGPDGEVVRELEEFIDSGGVVVQNEIYRWYTDDAPRIAGAIRVGSFHKLAGRWSRLGWICGGRGVDLSRTIRHYAPPDFWQLAWGRFLQDGALSVLTRRARDAATCARRAAECLGVGAQWSGNGPSLVVRLRGSDPTEVLLARLGIRSNPGPAFFASDETLRLCFIGYSPEGVDWDLVGSVRSTLGGTVVDPREHDRAV